MNRYVIPEQNVIYLHTVLQVSHIAHISVDESLVVWSADIKYHVKYVVHIYW